MKPTVVAPQYPLMPVLTGACSGNHVTTIIREDLPPHDAHQNRRARQGLVENDIAAAPQHIDGYCGGRLHQLGPQLFLRRYGHETLRGGCQLQCIQSGQVGGRGHRISSRRSVSPEQ